MPEVKITIGTREFEVACQPGEEDFLTAAAALLDEQAQIILQQVGRMPEARTLLMSGLMLADKINAAQERVRKLEAELATLQSAAPVIAGPTDAQLNQLSDLVAISEAIAEKAESQLGDPSPQARDHFVVD
jgi:cell division protein ZapA